VCDESTAGLSGIERGDLMRLINRLRDGGLAVLLIEHDMDFVMTISDRVYVLNYSRRIAPATPDTVIPTDRHDSAFERSALADYSSRTTWLLSSDP
jgi:branched-chain amino acid transport system permease protein